MPPIKRSKKAVGAPRKLERPAAAPQQSTAIVSRFEVGVIVIHPMFGEGTVTAVDEHKLTIHFRQGRAREILDAYVKRQS